MRSRISAAFCLCVLALGLAGPAWADRLPGPEELEVTELPLRVVSEHLVLVSLRDETLPAVSSSSTDASPELDAVAGQEEASVTSSEGAATSQSSSAAQAPPGSLLSGTSPWRFFDGVFDESSCRAPRMSEDAYAALAICRGLDPQAPGAEHVVLRRGYGVLRYPLPVATDIQTEADLSADGERFAVLVSEGGARTLHVVDLATRSDLRVSGGWRLPESPRLSAGTSSVAFVAQIGGRPAAVVANLEDQKAWRAWRQGKRVEVRGLSEDGRRVLVLSDPASRLQAFTVEVERGLSTNLSGNKGDVAAADLHPVGEQVVFSSSVGGVCAVWWTDGVARRRSDMFSSLDRCYGEVRLERGRRFVLFERIEGRALRIELWDRKTRSLRWTLPEGCSGAELSGDGAYISARCSRDPRGPGLYVFAVPERRR